MSAVPVESILASVVAPAVAPLIPVPAVAPLIPALTPLAPPPATFALPDLDPSTTVFVCALNNGALDQDSMDFFIGCVEPSARFFRVNDDMGFISFSSADVCRLALRMAPKVKLQSGSSMLMAMDGGDKAGGAVHGSADSVVAGKLASRPPKRGRPLVEQDMPAADRVKQFRVINSVATPMLIAAHRRRVLDDAAARRLRMAAAPPQQQQQQGAKKTAELTPTAAATLDRQQAANRPKAGAAVASAAASAAAEEREQQEQSRQADSDDAREDDNAPVGFGVSLDQAKRQRKIVEAPKIFAAAEELLAAQAPPPSPPLPSGEPERPASKEEEPAPRVRTVTDPNERFKNALASITENRIDWAAADRVNAADLVCVPAGGALGLTAAETQLGPWMDKEFTRLLGETDPEVVAFIKAQIRGHATRPEISHHVTEILDDATQDFMDGLWRELKQACKGGA
jgi:hypothetical protein